jgi:hypothetical protein
LNGAETQAARFDVEGRLMSELAFVNNDPAASEMIRGAMASVGYTMQRAPDEWRGRRALAEEPANLVASAAATAPGRGTTNCCS